MINLYNDNTEAEQSILSNFLVLLEKFDLNRNKRFIFVGDFKLFFYSSLDASGGNSDHVELLLAKLFELKEKFDFCDIWRMRNHKTRRFTKQTHTTGFIQPRFSYIFIPNGLQFSAKNKFILIAISTDCSPVFLSVSTEDKKVMVMFLSR